MKGLIANIFRSGDRDYSNGGLSSRADTVTVINAEGPFAPQPDRPAVILKVMKIGTDRHVYAVPAELDGHWTMFGGTYISTSDSRFVVAASKLAGHRINYPIPLHDRVETKEEYDRLSR